MSIPESYPAAQTSGNPAPFTFKQENGALFVLFLKTMLLTVVTLGIYSFWGRVNITRYLYNHTSFGSKSFDYHATGKEMFIGFLKGMAIVLGIVVVFGLIIKLLPMLRIPILILAYGGFGLFLVPLIMVGKWRFLLSRSSYCNVRFRHDGKFSELKNTWIGGILLTMVTLGFYWPVVQNKIQKYFSVNARFGNFRFDYTGLDREFFGLWLKGVLLTIVTLGIYSFWFTASITRYVMSHTTLDGRKFNSTMTGGGLFSVAIINLCIVIGTLTLGFPIAVNRMYNYFFSNLTLDIKPEELSATAAGMDTGASALASGIEEAANVLDAVSGII